MFRKLARVARISIRLPVQNSRVLVFLALLPVLAALSGCFYGVSGAVGPVDFYGKVVDQYGEPVVGAQVGFSVGGRFYAPGIRQAYTRTDEQGLFEIHEVGANIELNGVRHPDIDFQFPDAASGVRIGSRVLTMTFYDALPVKGRSAPLLSDVSESTPYVFKAWRIEGEEKVKAGMVFGYVEPTGDVFTYDLDKKRRYRTIKGEAEGHLRVTCKRGGRYKKGSWKVTISPVNGGIQPTDDLYMNIAPDSGYLSSVTIEMEEGSPGYKPSVLNKRFYFNAKNGRVYGSLFVNIQPYATLDMCRVQVPEFKINSNGSRNLALRRFR